MVNLINVIKKIQIYQMNVSKQRIVWTLKIRYSTQHIFLLSSVFLFQEKKYNLSERAMRIQNYVSGKLR